MRLRYTKPALANLRELIEFIDRRSSQGARHVRQRLRSLIEQLPDQPLVGQRTDDPTIRRLTSAPYPYLIFYEVTDAEVIIHAIRHGARDPPTMPGQR